MATTYYHHLVLYGCLSSYLSALSCIIIRVTKHYNKIIGRLLATFESLAAIQRCWQRPELNPSQKGGETSDLKYVVSLGLIKSWASPLCCTKS